MYRAPASILTAGLKDILPVHDAQIIGRAGPFDLHESEAFLVAAGVRIKTGLAAGHGHQQGDWQVVLSGRIRKAVHVGIIAVNPGRFLFIGKCFPVPPDFSLGAVCCFAQLPPGDSLKHAKEKV